LYSSITRYSLLVFALCLFLTAAATPASATAIYYRATETGTTVNGTTFSTYFQVLGHDFNSNELLAVIFPYANYLNDIVDTTPPDPNWSVQIFEPDLVLGLPTDGEVDFIPGADGISAPTFFLTYTYLTSETIPIVQDWQILDSGTFATLDSGQTIPLPEPATPLLFGGGLALAWILRKRLSQPSR
jgi:hypothetical protein